MMYRRRWTAPWLVGLMLIGLAAGCSDDAKQPVDPGTQNENPDLDDPLGGFTTQDEQPAFGDQDLASSATSEAPVDDSMAGDPDVTIWQASDSTKVYAVTMMWGVLDGDPSVRNSGGDGPSDAPAMEWNGSAQVNEGAIVVRSTIAFEAGDEIIDPRTDRRLVEWVSHTTEGFDGVRLVVIDPHASGTGTIDGTFTVKAGTNEWSFPIGDLAQVETIYDIDETNKFSIRAFEISPKVCARGFVGGAWLPPSEDEERGTFRGRWVSVDGSLAGFVRGHYGVNDAGDKVFFGKCIDLDGNFKAIVRGHYGENGREGGMPGIGSHVRSHGWFRGEWVDENEVVTGHIGGHWRSILGAGEGFFEGHWNDGCDRP